MVWSYQAPFCSRASASTTVDGFFFVHVGIIVVEEATLRVYEAEDWNNKSAIAEVKQEIDMMPPFLLIAQPFGAVVVDMWEDESPSQGRLMRSESRNGSFSFLNLTTTANCEIA